jgi:hypothetical protein
MCDSVIRVWPEHCSMRGVSARDRREAGGLVWDDDGFLVRLPITRIAAEGVDQADRWRGQRRIELRDWPAWM